MHVHVNDMIQVTFILYGSCIGISILCVHTCGYIEDTNIPIVLAIKTIIMAPYVHSSTSIYAIHVHNMNAKQNAVSMHV